jgi:hypothetical protein
VSTISRSFSSEVDIDGELAKLDADGYRPLRTGDRRYP